MIYKLQNKDLGGGKKGENGKNKKLRENNLALLQNLYYNKKPVYVSVGF